MIPALDADRQGPSGRIRSRNSVRAEHLAKRRRFGQARGAEMRFRRQLKKVAKVIGSIVSGLAPGGVVSNASAITQTLRRYSDLLQPWAAAVSKEMVEAVARSDTWAWASAGKEIGRGLRREIEGAPIGEAMGRKMAESEALIKSLPLEAAKRVNELIFDAMPGGVRAAETAKEIARTEEVSANRAMLIARSQTSRAATAMVEARAVFVGSEAYTWETAGDVDVRESHAKMQGKVVRWDEPPTLDGMTGHAGEFPNCRCRPRPIIPEIV